MDYSGKFDPYDPASVIDHYDGDEASIHAHFLEISEGLTAYCADLEPHSAAQTKAVKQGRKVLKVQLAFVALALLFTGLNLVDPGLWWIASVACSCISFVFAVIHTRKMREFNRASAEFDRVEPPASVRGLVNQIATDVDTEHQSRRWWKGTK